MNPFTEKSAPTKEHHQQWNPYDFHGGNVIAVAGKDFCVVGGDTRISTGYQILHRNTPKLYPLTNTCILAAAGMLSDVVALDKYLKARLTMYEFNNFREPGVDSVATLLSRTLYQKRFFPYYAFCLMAGVDEKGGAVYGYDAVGSFERVPYAAEGSGTDLIMSSLDKILQGYNTKSKKDYHDLSEEEVVRLVVDVFNSCAERDIYTGDHVQVAVVRKEGIKMLEPFKLRFD
eukprot:CAMPEP_0176425188 /NCGR_PEP_ID=MMETSP0127-20121128/11254_1 /TAXON_ID=938130 /ORGANISM="Platyophrya macrostoma, Strain WH" /LENGTH=230 /DNA_ID=CAMNT_0017806329 /DNA_START=73 /DNA_END=765 /DNA_ORIENTATION=+